jgi:hypothetical protein
MMGIIVFGRCADDTTRTGIIRPALQGAGIVVQVNRTDREHQDPDGRCREMTLTDDEGNTISENDAIKTGLSIIEGCPAEDDSDFSKGLRAMRRLIKAHGEKRSAP